MPFRLWSSLFMLELYSTLSTLPLPFTFIREWFSLFLIVSYTLLLVELVNWCCCIQTCVSNSFSKASSLLHLISAQTLLFPIPFDSFLCLTLSTMQRVRIMGRLDRVVSRDQPRRRQAQGVPALWRRSCAGVESALQVLLAQELWISIPLLPHLMSKYKKKLERTRCRVRVQESFHKDESIRDRLCSHRLCRTRR